MYAYLQSLKPLPLVLLLAGCATAGPVSMAPSKLNISERNPINAAIIVPAASRALSITRYVASSCFSSGDPKAPFGQVFAETVQHRFSQLFDRVSMVGSVSEAKDADSIFEVSLTDLTYKHGCMAAPEAGFTAKGSLRALDGNGKEIWRSPRTESRLEYSGMADTLNLGSDITKRIAGLVEDWVMELQSVSMAKYAPGAAVPEPSSVAARKSSFPSRVVAVNFAKMPTRADDIAVIIGNADYSKLSRDIPDVKPAYADAESFKRYALTALGVREGNIIFLRDATGAQLQRVFGSERTHKGQLFDWVRPNRSKVWIYYAGHGAPAGQDGSAFLVPVDADASRIEINGFPLSTLYENLSKLPAKSVTVVLEACFSGASQAGTVIPRASGLYVYARVPPTPRNITVISAGSPDQIASWDQDGSHGLFTKFYLTGMAGAADAAPDGNGDGKVGDDELQSYLRRTMTYYARRYYGRDQNASIVTGNSGQ